VAAATAAAALTADAIIFFSSTFKLTLLLPLLFLLFAVQRLDDGDDV
jgi:hypothetical protein